MFSYFRLLVLFISIILSSSVYCADLLMEDALFENSDIIVTASVESAEVSEEIVSGDIEVNEEPLKKRRIKVKSLRDTGTKDIKVEEKLEITPKVIVPDDIAAIVNGKTITVDELNLSVENALKQLERQEKLGHATEITRETTVSTKRNILNEMIDSIIIKDEAAHMGLTVPTSQIEAKIYEIRMGFPDSDSFLSALSDEGIELSSLKDGIIEQLLIEVISEKLTSELVIEEWEIKRFYENNREMFYQPQRRIVSKIVLGSSVEAEDVLVKLEDGESYEDLQIRYSLSYSSNEEEMDEVIAYGQLFEPYNSNLFDLQVEQTSEVIPYQGQYVIFKILKVLDEEDLSTLAVKNKITKYLMVEHQQNLYYEWLQNVRRKAKIVINPRLFPDIAPSKEPSLNMREDSEIDIDYEHYYDGDKEPADGELISYKGFFS